MKKNKSRYSIFFVFFVIIASAQNTTLLGNIEAKNDLESIHITNKNKNFSTVSNTLGIFKIEAEKNDTLIFSAIQYKLKIVVVTQENILSRTITAELKEYVNELAEVIIGNTLTGNLEDDVNTIGQKRDINFYDLGIPGYTGKSKTQSERLLNEAGEFKPEQLLGLFMGSVPINPILNGISGRTKMLKKRVALENNTDLMNSLKARLSESFFNNNPLDEEKRMDFFTSVQKMMILSNGVQLMI